VGRTPEARAGLLGEVHDLDVLADTIVHAAAEESEETRTRWGERIASERHARIETYRQLTLGKTSLWNEWRMGLRTAKRWKRRRWPVARHGAGAGRQFAADGQVSRLAMRLYDGLKRAQAAPIFAENSLRKVLRAAARLHGIGAGLDPTHRKSSAQFSAGFACARGLERRGMGLADQRGALPSRRATGHTA